MNAFLDWLQKASAIAHSHAGVPNPSRSQAADALADLHSLMLAAPDSIKVRYKLIGEDELAEAGIGRANAIYDGGLAWPVPSGSSERDWCLAVAAQVRGLDRHLFDETRQGKGRPLERVTAGRDWSFVPCADPVASSASKARDQPYTRRGLAFHRAIPSEAEGYRVTLVDAPATDIWSPSGRDRLGAAMVDGLGHAPERTEDGFFIAEINLPDAGEGIVKQLHDLASQSCWLAVWPELTISPKTRRALALALKTWPLDRGEPPAFIVTGSCHEMADDGRVNRSVVLDARGKELAFHDKMVPFLEKGLGAEDIVPGKVIRVLVSRYPLIAIGICKDIADVGRDSPYRLLDVDLVVVPSMGRRTTAAGHVAAAKNLRSHSGSCVFTVQQFDPACEKKQNYVIPPAANLDSGPDGFLHSGSLLTHQWP